MPKMPHWPVPIWHLPTIQMDKLTRVENLLKAVGDPISKMPPIVHVAGTNGKGSTIAFLRAILEEAGYVVHSYSSPHLQNFNERINIGGRKIFDSELKEILEECRIASEKEEIPVTFFEGTTVAAFKAFAKFPADICLIETGMGGRLDATNVIPSPLMTIITSISLDHQDFLGHTLQEIAREKAGIMKKNAKNVISQQYEEILPVFFAKAEEIGTENFIFEYDFIAEIIKNEPSKFLYKDRNRDLILSKPNLVGDHQIINASNAIFAAFNLEGFNVTENHVQTGILKAKWPGRLQKITNGRVFEYLQNASLNFELWFDGAHNIGGAQILKNWLEKEKDFINLAICGTTKGKDFTKMLQILQNEITFLCGLTVEGEHSSYSASFITEMAKLAEIPAKSADSIEDAIELLVEFARKNHPEQKIRIIIFGSLYLAETVISVI